MQWKLYVTDRRFEEGSLRNVQTLHCFVCIFEEHAIIHFMEYACIKYVI